ncbi:MAG: hypothetical protein JZD41_07310 [Thermoproteus sp.]|nr:hypothetical protein [Thermoproteus sp.]
MGAAAGAATGASAVSTILDDLVTAFKTVFSNIYRFVKPGWVITFAAGAPIALNYIDQGIEIASKIAAKWADTLYGAAGNVFSGVYNWVCNQLGGCGGSNVFQSVAATIAAALASAPIWLAAIVVQYVVQPLVGVILDALKQIFNAVYTFVCNVLVPVVKVSIMAYVNYRAVKGVYRHVGSAIASWFSDDALKAIGKTFAVFAMPLASGFLASYMYDYILNITGACGKGVPILMPGAPVVTPISSTNTVTMKLTVTELLSASVLPSGATPPPPPYVVSVSESLSATLIGGPPYEWHVNVTETLSAAVQTTTLAQIATGGVADALGVATIQTTTTQTLAGGTADALGVATMDIMSAQVLASGTADALGTATTQIAAAQTLASGTADALGTTTIQIAAAQTLASGTADALGTTTIQIAAAQTLASGTADALGVAYTQVALKGTADALGTTTITVQ